MKEVSNYISKLSNTAFKKRGIQNIRIITDWVEIVGKEYSLLTTPQKVIDNNNSNESTLVLKAHPKIATDVIFNTDRIIEKINAYFGFKKIAKIKVIQSEDFDIPKPQINNEQASIKNSTSSDVKKDNNIDDITDNDIKELLYKIKSNLEAS